MNYNELNLHERINLKQTLREWASYATQHFQQNLDKQLYNKRSRKPTRRSGELRRTWYQNVQAGQGIDRVMIRFLMYGRFLDMGVGRGSSHTDRVVNRQLRLGRMARKRVGWYAKQKGYETHRLREILAKNHMSTAVALLENALTLTVPINLNG